MVFRIMPYKHADSEVHATTEMIIKEEISNAKIRVSNNEQ